MIYFVYPALILSPGGLIERCCFSQTTFTNCLRCLIKINRNNQFRSKEALDAIFKLFFTSVPFLTMTRLVVKLILLGLACCAYARKCNPDEGVEPAPCNPSSCALPDCACEGSEPSVPLADRPQVYQAITLFITRILYF